MAKTKENAVTNTRALISELIEGKNKQLSIIEDNMAKARADLDKAEAEIKAAAEIMDFDAYSAAKKAKEKAEFAIEMLTSRYTQLQRRELVTEERSDEVIDSILKYEKDRDDEFRSALAPIVEQLRAITKEYKDDVSEAEKVITSWTGSIHYNYRTSFNGKGDSRSKTPRAVHMVPHFGCDEAAEVRDFLEAIDRLNATPTR